MVQQQAEDAKVAEGHEDFNRFYQDLSDAMEIQVTESQSVKAALNVLEDSSREISNSMQEQKLGMEQSTEAVIQVRETAINLTTVIEGLRQLITRFKAV